MTEIALLRLGAESRPFPMESKQGGLVDPDDFIAAVSDDLTYLDQFERILETRTVPFEPLEQLYRPALARMYAILMINSLEQMSYGFRGQEPLVPLSKEPGKWLSNIERLEELSLRFVRAGIKVEPEILKDFLAIKYLRNAIVHGKWKNGQKAFVASQGFSTDPMGLGKGDLEKMRETHKKMLLYLFLANR